MLYKAVVYSIALLLLFVYFPVKAAEEVQVCAKHEIQNGWSKGYRVSAIYLDGFELNRLTNTLNYSGNKKYIVIFWGDGQASIIGMRFNFLSPVEQQGEDQKGVRWKVSKTAACF